MFGLMHLCILVIRTVSRDKSQAIPSLTMVFILDRLLTRRTSEIVASSPNGPIKRRSERDWRAFHMEWFENHKINKRGWGTAGSWWRDRFEALLDRNYNYGLSKIYLFSQTLYNTGINYEPYSSITLDVSC